jgi:hypothetical protein
VPISIGLKKIEAMPVEAVEEEVGVVSVDLHQNGRYEVNSRIKERYGV